jgi:hypothetical protein
MLGLCCRKPYANLSFFVSCCLRFFPAFSHQAFRQFLRLSWWPISLQLLQNRNCYTSQLWQLQFISRLLPVWLKSLAVGGFWDLGSCEQKSRSSVLYCHTRLSLFIAFTIDFLITFRKDCSHFSDTLTYRYALVCVCVCVWCDVMCWAAETYYYNVQLLFHSVRSFYYSWLSVCDIFATCIVAPTWGGSLPLHIVLITIHAFVMCCTQCQGRFQ